MGFNCKMGKIIENVGEEEAQKILGQIDPAFPQLKATPHLTSPHEGRGIIFAPRPS